MRKHWTHRSSLSAALLMTLIAAAGGESIAAAESRRPERAERPNVVVFLSDDQGWGDLSVHGNRQLQTPHIDSLARDGVALERFYVCALCAPTRAEFLTGRYHPRGGVTGVSTGQERLNPDAPTIADAFRKAGYATGAFGKWHNGSQWPYHPRARGFDEYYGFTSGHWGEYFDAPLEHDGRLVRGQGFIADDFTSRALEFIERHRERPFFCYVAFNTPHSPFCVPQKYWERFRNREITQRGSEGDKETIDVTRAVLAMCENLDDNVGRVLQRLEKLDLTNDTIVVFFCDNGPNSARWNGGMKGRKGTVDEGGVRSPCFFRWPGKLPAGQSVRPLASVLDLLPTLASLAQVSLAQHPPLDGRDLAPLLRDASAIWPERTLFQYNSGRLSARTDQFRLDPRGALYDMQSDPGQTRDAAREHPDVAARLKAECAAWRRDVLSGIKDVDDRPFTVGRREWPTTWLPARDGVPHGGVRRSAPAPNCSYFVHWTQPDDRITWDIEVHTPGRYKVSIWYTCAESDAGSKIEWRWQDARLEGRVEQAWDPPLITNQDVIPRPAAESLLKPFQPLVLGTVSLPAGRGLAELRALEIPGREVMHLRAIQLRLLDD
ncbi:MAG: arylsulfatase [Pirellulales bacterium]